jgi:hypothetical protein
LLTSFQGIRQPILKENAVISRIGKPVLSTYHVHGLTVKDGNVRQALGAKKDTDADFPIKPTLIPTNRLKPQIHTKA